MSTITVDNSPNFKAWIDTLATTTDPQVSNSLIALTDTGRGRRPGFCCLGIGCKRQGLEYDLHLETPHPQPAFLVPSLMGRTEFNSMPPIKFLTWLGITYHGEEGGDSADVLVDWPADARLVNRQCVGGEQDGSDAHCFDYSEGAELNEVCKVDWHTRYHYTNSDSGVASASALNDSAGLSFAQIADVFRYFGAKGESS